VYNEFDAQKISPYHNFVLRKLALVAVTGFALSVTTGCGLIGQDEGKTQGQIIEEVGDLGFYPKDTAAAKAPKKDKRGKIIEQEVEVFVGLGTREPDDPKAEACSAIVVWHANSPEDLVAVTGGYLMQDPTNDRLFDSTDPQLQHFKECWQPD